MLLAVSQIASQLFVVLEELPVDSVEFVNFVLDKGDALFFLDCAFFDFVLIGRYLLRAMLISACLSFSIRSMFILCLVSLRFF